MRLAACNVGESLPLAGAVVDHDNRVAVAAWCSGAIGTWPWTAGHKQEVRWSKQKTVGRKQEKLAGRHAA